MGTFTFQEKAVDAVLSAEDSSPLEGKTAKDEPIDTSLTAEDLYVVWFCKTLGNWKALISTDKFNGIYWEVTYNGAKDEAYVDRYIKARNTAVKV